MYIMLINVALPQNFLDFINMFSISMFDSSVRPISRVLYTFYDSESLIEPPTRFVDQGFDNMIFILLTEDFLMKIVIMTMIYALAALIDNRMRRHEANYKQRMIQHDQQ
jgi:hypothetical protein